MRTLFFIFLLFLSIGSVNAQEPVYTRVTDAEIIWEPPKDDRFTFNLTYRVDAWNPKSTEILLDECTLNITFTVLPAGVNQTECIPAITVYPQEQSVFEGKISLKVPSAGMQGIATAIITANLTGTGIRHNGSLVDIPLYETSVLVPNNGTGQFLPEPAFGWGSLGNNSPVIFRVANLHIPIYFPPEGYHLTVLTNSELINTQSDTYQLTTPNVPMTFVDVRFEGNLTSPPRLNSLQVIGRLVWTYEISPGITPYNSGGNFEVYNYTPALETDVDISIRLVFHGRDPDSSNFLPLLLRIRDGAVTKVVQPRPVYPTVNETPFSMA
ncbi:MAG: hypothetical protein D6732_08995, partial [Methanobacteriota archaeon]